MPNPHYELAFMGVKIGDSKMAQKSIKNDSKWVPKNAHFCDANLADVIVLLLLLVLLIIHAVFVIYTVPFFELQDLGGSLLTVQG